MAFAPNNSKVVQRLTELGIIPPECVSFEMSMHVNKPVRFRYEVYAKESQVQKIAEVFGQHPEEIQAAEKTTTPICTRCKQPLCEGHPLTKRKVVDVSTLKNEFCGFQISAPAPGSNL